MRDLFRNYIYPVATLSGSIIGVGFLSLPYITLKVGIWLMLFYFIILTALVVFLHVILGEISLKTPDFKRFPGFVGYYLGKEAKKITLVLTIFGSFGILLAYLIIGGQFLTAIFQPILGGNLFLYVFLYFLVLSLIIYFGVKLISKIEFWALSLLLILLFLIFVNGFSKISLNNIFIPNSDFKIFQISSKTLDFSDIRKIGANLFLPYGAIIFSLWGTGLIPEIEEMLRGRKNLFKRIIVISTLIPAVLYLFFIFLILGITGPKTTESALVGLKSFFGNGIVVPVALFIGVVTTFTAFIANGLLLKKIFIYDMGVKKLPAWVFTCFTPLILFLIGFNSFIPLISFIGGVILGINGIFILLMYRKIGGKNFIIYPLTLFFILGIIYEIVYFSF